MPYILLTFSCLLTLAGFLSQYGWGFDLASHFRLQYLAIQLVCMGLCVIHKRKKFLIFITLFALINFSLIIPYYFPNTSPSQNKITGTPLKILLINVNSSNTNYKAVSNYIQKISPDILALEEINARWIAELSPILKSYPHFKEVSQEDNFGIGLYSKISLDNVKAEYFVGNNLPSLVGKLIWQGQTLSLIFTHPIPPASAEDFRWRNIQLEQIGLLKPTLEKDIILIGDLNTTSWSHSFKKLKRDLDLKDSRQGFGLQTSWPSFLPYVGITIDHCLVSKDFVVVQRKIGPNVGSDHLPVFIKIILK